MISQIYENYFYLLNCTIRGEDLTEKLKNDPRRMGLLTELDWEELAEIAYTTKTMTLLFPAVARCGEIIPVGEGLLEQWKSSSKRIMLWQIEKQMAIREVIREAKNRGVELVFFKGMVLADLYPQYIWRNSSDTDIWVDESRKPEAMRMLEEMGYVRQEDKSKNHVQIYVQDKPYNAIELHTMLWEDYDGRQIDVLRSLNLTDPQSFRYVRACGSDVLTLDPRRHLVYQIFHIVKHFMLDGVGIRYMADLTLFIEKYMDQIDFKLFWENMDDLGYTRFCRHLFSICAVYLGLDVCAFMSGRAVVDPDTEGLLMDILRGGTAQKKNYHWQILGTMIPYFVGEKEVRRSKLGRKLDAIFLRPADLTAEYSYAKKHLILLPIAWIHRAYKYMAGYFFNRKNLYSANEKLDVAEYRLHLVNRMGLADEKK